MKHNEGIIGKTVDIIVDRPLGSRHPKHKELLYPVNYGYVAGVMGGDGEEQDVYLLGVDAPVSRFRAEVIAVIHRLDDVEDKWVVCPPGMHFTREEIARQVDFMEKYFDSRVELVPDLPTL